MRIDVFHLMAAIKELHRDIEAMRKDIDELRDDVKASGMNPFQALLNGLNNEEDDDAEETDDDESESVHSAPATVSYEREERA